MASRVFPYLARGLAVAGVYFGGAKLGLSLAFAAEQVTVIWPPSGISLAAVLLLGYGVWPGIVLGAFLANATAHEPLTVAAGIAVGNTLEALAGAWLLRKVVGFDNALGRLKDALGLVVLAAGVSTMVSATVGVLSLCLGGVQRWADFGSLWGIWWLGDAVGDLVIAPLLLTWAVGWRRDRPRGRPAEMVALAAGLAAVSVAVFAGVGRQPGPGYPLEYTLFPFLIWAAVRFGSTGSATVTFAAVVVAVSGTVGGSGPFIGGSIHESLLLLTVYMTVMALSGLVLGAVTTEQHRAEAALRQSEERYRDLFENANDVIYTLDLDGHITSLNRRAEQTFGFSREQCCGKSAADVVPPEYHEHMREALRRKLAGEKAPTVYELEVVSKDGRRVPMEVSSRLILHDGRPVGVQGTARDITERKRAEEALRQADRRKDEFLAMLAHELRNPLAPLRNGLHLLRLTGDDRAQAEKVLGMMGRQVEHLVRLVDDLLDVSRIMRGMVELRRQPLDLATVIGRAVETVQPFLAAQGHELSVELPPEPVALEGDAVRLAQVFANLLNNAVKYTEPGGHIALSAARAGGEVLVSVRDTGIGIAPEILPHVFDLFVQADRSHTRSHSGLGIGLTLVRRLVEMHGGSVTAASAGPGKGSEFVVHLPVTVAGELRVPSPPSRDRPDEPGGSPTATRGKRILVVDDNKDAATSLALLLRLGGHSVQVAHDGPEALEAVRSAAPEVVLLDIGMPGMDGYEVARRLRQTPGLEGVLLVALTGWGQEHDRRRSKEAGFDHHLTKPADPQALRDLFAAPASP